MKITKIVITGGPSGGKTTAMSWVQNAFTKLGYTVLFVPETATEFITGGVAPWTCGTNLEYQKVQMRLQLEKERLFEQAARTMKADKLLIVCDRGAIDNKVYMTDEDFAQVLADVGCSERELLDRYDAVFHLVTAAKGLPQFYTLENNKARYESIEQAADVDDRLIAAWSGHRHLRVIDNATDFNSKLRRLIAEMRAFLGEPQPREIQRKFLIAYPDLDWLESLPEATKMEIVQTDLISREDVALRVHQRAEGDSVFYFKTYNHPLDDSTRVEVEERLSKREYQDLLQEADPNKKQVRKTRYRLTHEGQYFEIDLFPMWSDKAILETELSEEDTPIHFPGHLGIIREVTEDAAYTRAAIAEQM